MQLANVERLLDDRSSTGPSLDVAARACTAIAWPRALLSLMGTARINRILARLRNSLASGVIVREAVDHLRAPLINENSTLGAPFSAWAHY